MLEQEMMPIPYEELRCFMGGNYSTGDYGGPGCTLSGQGLQFIKSAEGYSSTIYRDTGGKPTVGYGHKLTQTEIANGTYANGITEAQASALLSQDTTTAVNAVNSKVAVSLTQCQFDALASFVYNVGGGNFSSSDLLSKLNAGNYAGAADELSRWVYSGGQTTTGLVTRRDQEDELFSGCDYNYFN